MAHVYKAEHRGNAMMAMDFRKLTGIAPFVIDQIYTFGQLYGDAAGDARRPRAPGIYVASTKEGLWSV